MNIGLASIYAFRPHVEHLWYLALLLRAAGHQTHFLACDGALEQCYARALKGTSRARECPACILGGIRSFSADRATSISRSPLSTPAAVHETLAGVVDSSISTLLRTETDEHLESPAAARLRSALMRAAERTYLSALNWIRTNRLEAIICFNGRMDVTKAVTRAGTSAGIPFITVERTWFGDGLHLVPGGDCLSLGHVRSLNRLYRDAPLSLQQARRIARLLASRFLKRNGNEWRAYNRDAVSARWPVSGAGRRVLLLPSSWNECQGHPDWGMRWETATAAFDWLFLQLGLAPRDVVVRCHPNWAERIGRLDGRLSESHYARWAAERGYHCIASNRKDDTFDLIDASDLVVLNGGSAAFEAGALGKPIVCIGSAHYADSGLAIHLCDPAHAASLDALRAHDRDAAIKAALRYGYTLTHRHAQYVDFVQAITPTRYRYYRGADADRLVAMLRTGTVRADDPLVAADATGEAVVVEDVRHRRWQELFEPSPAHNARVELKLRRRRGLAWIDSARELLPPGDRL